MDATDEMYYPPLLIVIFFFKFNNKKEVFKNYSLSPAN